MASPDGHRLLASVMLNMLFALWEGWRSDLMRRGVKMLSKLPTQNESDCCRYVSSVTWNNLSLTFVKENPSASLYENSTLEKPLQRNTEYRNRQRERGAVSSNWHLEEDISEMSIIAESKRLLQQYCRLLYIQRDAEPELKTRITFEGSQQA